MCSCLDSACLPRGAAAPVVAACLRDWFTTSNGHYVNLGEIEASAVAGLIVSRLYGDAVADQQGQHEHGVD